MNNTFKFKIVHFKFTNYDFRLKQNKIQQELSSEKSNYNDELIASIAEMKADVEVYKSKLVSVKKHLTNIHKKTKHLKKRSDYIMEYKQKEFENKTLKRNHEESLIPNISNPNKRNDETI